MDKNPFSLMFGKSPLSIIDRQVEYMKIYDDFNESYPSTYSYLITGIRGSGKTVLLRRLALDFSQQKKLDCFFSSTDLYCLVQSMKLCVLCYHYISTT